MQVQVLRPFPGSEPAGAVMDTATWPANRAHQLIKRRYVLPLALAATAATDGDQAQRPKGARR